MPSTITAEKIALCGVNSILRGVDSLYRHIDERLRAHKYCVVFENELQRVWPTEKRERLKRAAAIENFARAHHLTATIHDPGVRVTFLRISAGAS